MFLKQYYLACLSHASYLIGDETTGSAVVVDPQRDVDGYLEDAARAGLRIEHVFLTHFHADFVAGHLELAARVGARIHLGAKAQAEFPFSPARDGDKLVLGRVRLEILETPGHTPEGISILVVDTERDAEVPHGILTGDTLFIGDVGRPDLLSAKGLTARDLANSMYATLREKILPLPDSTLVYPAHGAGSACGKNLSRDTFSTLGVQKRVNWALQPMDRESFVRVLTADQPAMPAYFPYDAELNGKVRATLEESLAAGLRPLTLEQVLHEQAAGALVLDAREPGEWTAGHLRGSVNVGLSGTYASWVGALIPATRPLILVAPPGRQLEAAVRLGRIGFDRLAGYLDGGAAAWRGREDLLRQSTRLSPMEFAARLAHAHPPCVLDVRTQAEWDAGRLPGAVHIPLPELAARAGELPRDRPIAVHCKGGYRSVIAVSLLEPLGLGPLSDLEGGYQAWVAAGQTTLA
ncbi:MAG: MBL fold metallo-hydrolase [Planctomycetes bacterium]|nr:MBL fold metallo-hydrolase [Planctomycetota bacterium]